ncbi:superoxide dismutase family protein [uncultured Marinobacter sp.]|uniref:superoxide dismutase family protein n=1 Tax=uncultured Marinobacter sp. TaxID=187379 RepID=UPI00262C950A|nr:superoxide dismutase family protein [uncultured Marinobacter sp.]
MIIFLRCAALAVALMPAMVTAVDEPDTGAEEAGGNALSVSMSLATRNGKSKDIGTIRVEEKIRGIVLAPHLKGLRQGAHGFHVHEHDDCSSVREEAKSGSTPEYVAAGNEGGHLSSGLADSHTGPYGDGHLGDLPILYVDNNGVANHPVYAPRLRLNDLPGRALVIHANPDNYSDDPEENGGSGPIIACGIVDGDK